MSDGLRVAAAGSGGGGAVTYFTGLRAFLVDSMRYPWDAVPSLGGSVPAIRALDKLEDILASSENFLQKMHERGNDPHQHKQLNRLFSPSEAAAMVGRDRTTLARAEAELGMESLQRNPQNNRRVGYSLQQIQDFRKHFGTLPWRDPVSDPALIIACQNFKGGVGKSTTCVNFAHYLALKGYRVLVVDTDSQATTTSMFGYMPDAEITQEHTLLPYLDSTESSLVYAVRKTYWPNIDLIPSCLALYEAEMAIAAHLATQADLARRVEFFSELKFGLQSVSEPYDIVLLDSPPALGLISLNVLLAADALVVPTAPRMYDFTSTVQFFRMVHNYIGLIDPTKEYRWISVLTTLFDQRLTSHKQFFEVMKACFGDGIFQHVFFSSSEIINSAVQYLGSYEQPKPNRKVLEMLDGIFGEIELRVMREWPSKRAALQEKGIA
jgi:chromosome partitioning protein